MWHSRGKQSQEFDNIPALVRFDYTYKTPFENLCTAYLKNWNWEKRTQLTTIAAAEQPDDDTLVYIRRQDRVTAPLPAWERVTINRRDKTMTAEALSPNADGSFGVMNRHSFKPDGDATRDVYEAFNILDRENSLDQFTAQVAHLSKTMKFAAWDQE